MTLPSTKAKLLLLGIALFGGLVIAFLKIVVVPILMFQEPVNEVTGGIRGQNYEMD